MHCPENHFCFIQSCWEENPHRRPSFSEIKDRIFNHPVFPQHDDMANDGGDGANGHNSLAPPSSYEIMRRHYQSIQCTSPAYLTMVGKRRHSSSVNSESISGKMLLGTIEEGEAQQDNSNLLRFPSEENNPLNAASSIAASIPSDINTGDKDGSLDLGPGSSEEDELLLRSNL